MDGDVTPLGLAASLLLVAVSIAISRAQQLRLERDMVVSVVRSLAQLLLAGAALGLVVDEDAPILLSWLWVAAIVVFAAATVRRRAPRLPGVFTISLAANAGSAVVGLGTLFALGIFPMEGRTVVPLAGMVVGNAFKSGVLAVLRLTEAVGERRDDVEARLALGLPAPDAVRPIVRGTLRLAISPQVENIKGLGIMFLPGAMTGLILAGVDPLDAVLVQLALMYVILGGVVTTTTVTTLLTVRRLVTPDHRLVPFARETRDE
ncbi:MAG TPA: ABC transporter permease [Baekduia sp.]|nr:ABC transporter permease [Baekduia sp.]